MQPFRHLQEPRDWSRLLAIITIGIGASLRIWQAGANPSLWLDEAALANNIVDLPFPDLFQPLRYGQVAPIGFLMLERAAVLALGASELALRLVPLVSGVLALVVFESTARRLLTPWYALLATWLFAVAVPLVFFSAEVKPYGVDVLAAVLITWTVSAPISADWRTTAALASLGLLAWVSNPAALILAGTGAALAILHVVRGVPRLRQLAVVGGLWVLIAAPAVWLTVRSVSPDNSAYLQQRWAAGFVPRAPRRAIGWALDQLKDMFGASGTWVFNGGLHYGYVWIFVGLLAGGAVWFWRQRRDVLVLMSGPMAVALGASVLRTYPFTERFIIFLIPSLLLLVAAGANQLSTIFRVRLAGAALAGTLIVLSTAALARTPPPQRQEDLRPVLVSIGQQCRPDDVTYVYYGAGQAYRFYAQRLELPCREHVIGRCARGRPDILVEDLEAMRGKSRIWIVISHASSHPEDVTTLRTYLDSIGRQAAHIMERSGNDAQAYLYEIDDYGWQKATAAPPAPRLSADDAWGCTGPLVNR